MPSASNEITELLAAAQSGDGQSWQDLADLVYAQLRSIAIVQMQSERADHTLQPTALVHETFIRLCNQKKLGASNRAEFFGAVALVMRRVLVDHYRRSSAKKRHSGGDRLALDEVVLMTEEEPDRVIDPLVLDEALSEFEKIDAKRSRLVELRFFGGLSLDQAADTLGVSRSSVKRDWRIARAWLLRRLGPDSAD